MHSEYHRALLIFVDGLGLAPAAESNPLSTAPTPHLRQLLGGPLTIEQCRQDDDLMLTALDAGLGIAGLPQSATGQTALFTGINAPQRLGRHITGLPGPRLKAIIEERNLFGLAGEAGLKATFANPYTPAYLEAIESGHRRPSVTTHALLVAGLEPRRVSDLEKGEAVSWDICRDHLQRQLELELPPVTAQEAGRHLAGVAARHDLTVYETFMTDLTGHGRDGFSSQETLGRLDGLIGGVLAAAVASLTILVTSDHGNVENITHKRHTENPVPLLVVGPLAGRFRHLTSIDEVTVAILAPLTPGGARGES